MKKALWVLIGVLITVLAIQIGGWGNLNTPILLVYISWCFSMLLVVLSYHVWQYEQALGADQEIIQGLSHTVSTLVKLHDQGNVEVSCQASIVKAMSEMLRMQEILFYDAADKGEIDVERSSEVRESIKGTNGSSGDTGDDTGGTSPGLERSSNSISGREV